MVSTSLNILHLKQIQSKELSSIYIKKNVNFISGQDLDIYKKKELESTFVELMNISGKIVIVGCLYTHPNMNPS